MEAVDALRRIALILEMNGEPTYRVRAFRRAAATVAELGPGELNELARRGRLRSLAGIGEVTEAVILEALAGHVPAYLASLEEPREPRVPDGGPLRALLRGDCHTHSDWSDGGSPIAEMAEAAIALGHEYIALTDHSPRLSVANGLSPERLRAQLELVATLNARLAPFRILTGIEVDILDDGALDQEEEMLAQLDIVVASVHSKLRMEEPLMTARMLAAVANPHMDILGHCTGRLVGGRTRPESTFDAHLVFAACRQFDKAVEVNARPERLDPPRRLLRQAVAAGCRFSVDSDAHAPGQLSWQPYGTRRATECGVIPGQVVNTWPSEQLLAWAAGHAIS